MKCWLESHTAKTIHGRQVVYDQYKVCFEDKDYRAIVGYVGFKAGSAVCFITKLGPIEKKFIVERVAKLLESENPLRSVEPVDIPPELMEDKKDDDIEIDFD